MNPSPRPYSLAQPTTARRARLSSAAHARAWPNRPTAHDEGRPVRNGKYAWAPPKYYVITASSRILFHQSKVLQLHPLLSPSPR